MPVTEPYLADDGITRVSPPSPRTALFWDGTHWHVPRVDGHGRVQVRGEDQLFSFRDPLAWTRTAVISGADGYLDTNVVGPGLIFVVTNVFARDITSPTTEHWHIVRHGAADFHYNYEAAAFGAGIPSVWTGHLYLVPTDYIRVYFTGGLAGDSCHIVLTGYVVTLEV